MYSSIQHFAGSVKRVRIREVTRPLKSCAGGLPHGQSDFELGARFSSWTLSISHKTDIILTFTAAGKNRSPISKLDSITTEANQGLQLPCVLRERDPTLKREVLRVRHLKVS